MGYSPWGGKESDITESLTLPLSKHLQTDALMLNKLTVRRATGVNWEHVCFCLCLPSFTLSHIPHVSEHLLNTRHCDGGSWEHVVHSLVKTAR